MDYQFLLGRDFSVGEDTYTIREIAVVQDLPLVYADLKSTASDGALTSRRFPIHQVLQSLLVEEEIVLFNPGYLGAAGH